MQTKSLVDLDERPSQSHRIAGHHDDAEDIGQKMTHDTAATEDQGTLAVPPSTTATTSTAAAVGVVQDALDGNAEFLTMVRDKSNKKRKEAQKRQQQQENGDTTAPLADKKKKKKKRVTTKQGDFFDDLFG
jgi:hypothetical protein